MPGAAAVNPWMLLTATTIVVFLIVALIGDR